MSQIYEERTPQNVMTTDADKVWPGAIIPYEIDTDISKLYYSFNEQNYYGIYMVTFNSVF